MKMVSFRAPFVKQMQIAFVPALAAVALAGCAGSRPLPDPRDPAPVKDSPVVLRVCYVDGDGAHLAVGDQVELTTSNFGRLRIRHIPGPENQGGQWNGGEPAKVKATVLVERSAPRGNKVNTRKFVPVGRFHVRLGDAGAHAPFDFQQSKVVAVPRVDKYPDCNAEIGDDEVLVRGVEDQGRHGGTAHLR